MHACTNKSRPCTDPNYTPKLITTNLTFQMGNLIIPIISIPIQTICTLPNRYNIISNITISSAVSSVLIITTMDTEPYNYFPK